MGPQGLGLEITELRLGLPGSGDSEKKRVFSGGDGGGGGKNRNMDMVVGWPPVCLYRKNNISMSDHVSKGKMYVKVSMDGAPILRKVDLSCFKGYEELGMAFEKLFGCFGIGMFSFVRCEILHMHSKDKLFSLPFSHTLSNLVRFYIYIFHYLRI